MRFGPRQRGDYLQRLSGGRWRYRRHVPEAWRPIVGQRYWVVSFGRVDRNEAVQRARVLATEHEALIAHFERIGYKAAAEQRMAQLREMAALAQQDAAENAPSLKKSFCAG
jgi:hypothetical protein